MQAAQIKQNAFTERVNMLHCSRHWMQLVSELSRKALAWQVPQINLLLKSVAALTVGPLVWASKHNQLVSASVVDLDGATCFPHFLKLGKEILRQ